MLLVVNNTLHDDLDQTQATQILVRFIEQNAHDDVKVIHGIDELGRFKHCRSVSGIVLTGSDLRLTCGVDPIHIEPARYVLEQCSEVPVLGICFGHQLMAYLDGGVVSPLMGGLREEWRRVDVYDPNRYRKDTLVPSGTYIEKHNDYVRLVPMDWDVMAMSLVGTNRVVEVMRHCYKPRWGVQFHPELSGPTGDVLLNNFLRLCNDKWKVLLPKPVIVAPPPPNSWSKPLLPVQREKYKAPKETVASGLYWASVFATQNAAKTAPVTVANCPAAVTTFGWCPPGGAFQPYNSTEKNTNIKRTNPWEEYLARSKRASILPKEEVVASVPSENKEWCDEDDDDLWGARGLRDRVLDLMEEDAELPAYSAVQDGTRDRSYDWSDEDECVGTYPPTSGDLWAENDSEANSPEGFWDYNK